MAPTPKATVTTPRRQSCDRCYGQKLRCIRAGDSDTGACNRCLRQGAECVYSSSLPKGRPSMYRLADASTTSPANPLAVTSITPELRRRHPAGPHIATADANPNANANANANVHEDAILAGLMDTSTSTSTWPWLAPMNWNDMQVDGSEQDSSQWTSNGHTMVNPQNDAGAAFLDASPSLLGWASTGNGDGDGSARGGAPSPTRLHEHGHGRGNDLFESSSSSSIIIDEKGPDVGIARLSQLSTRLSSLHRSSCTLAETAGSSSQSRDGNQARQSPLIDDAAFQTVAAWLVHVSANMKLLFRTHRRNPALEKATTGDTLHDIFSASHHLLDILRCFQVDVVIGTSPLTSTVSTSTSTGGAHLDFWASITPQSAQPTSSSTENISYFEKGMGSSGYARPLSQSSNAIVRHLLIACHTLLLNIYVAVLIALQHDADLRSSYLPTGNVDADVSVDAAALGDIRLVLVVQLCSYLIDRQHQAVNLYLSPPSSSQQYELSGSQQPSLPASTTADREVMSDLEMEVQQRLARLRRTLRI